MTLRLWPETFLNGAQAIARHVPNRPMDFPEKRTGGDPRRSRIALGQ